MSATSADTQRVSRIDKLIFLVIGFACYAWVLRFEGLSPSNVDWLIRDDMQPPIGNDPTTHYLGWEFFRDGSLSAWPPGRSTLLGPGKGASIALTDSLSLAAIPIRFILRIVGYNGPFQYLGPWMLVNFLLQSLFGGLLLQRLCRWRITSYVGAALFGLAPIFVYRLGYNVVHSSQWVLLAGMYLVTKPSTERGKWVLLSAGATAINPYLTAMILLLLLSQRIISCCRLKRIPLHVLVDVTAVLGGIIFTGYLIGLFVYSGGTLATFGFGDYSANLLSLVDPIIQSRLALSPTWSAFGLLPDTADGSVYQWEGFGYLGTGVIVGIAIATVGQLRLLARSQAWWLVTTMVGVAVAVLAEASLLTTVAAAMVAGILVGFVQPMFGLPSRVAPSLTLAALLSLIVAVSNRVFVGAAEYGIPVPSSFIDLFGFIRVSGRLIWVTVYVVMLASLLLLENVTKNQKLRALVMCSLLLLQVTDGREGYAAMGNFMKGPRTQVQLTASLWRELANRYSNIAFVPPGQRLTLDNPGPGEDQAQLSEDFWFAERQLWADLGEYAVKHKMSLNAFYFARNPSRESAAEARELQSVVARNAYREDTLYIFVDAPLWNQAKATHRSTDAIGLLNGVPILAPGLRSCEECALTDLLPVKHVSK
jgi:hypothetical protein